jgi:hypothetical protein
MRSDPTCDDGLNLDTWLRDFRFEARQAAPPPKTFDLNLRSESTSLATAITAVVTDPRRSGQVVTCGRRQASSTTRLDWRLTEAWADPNRVTDILGVLAHAVLKCARCNQRSNPAHTAFSRRPTFRFESRFQNRGTPDQDAVFLVRVRCDDGRASILIRHGGRYSCAPHSRKVAWRLYGFLRQVAIIGRPTPSQRARKWRRSEPPL